MLNFKNAWSLKKLRAKKQDWKILSEKNYAISWGWLAQSGEHLLFKSSDLSLTQLDGKKQLVAIKTRNLDFPEISFAAAA